MAAQVACVPNPVSTSCDVSETILKLVELDHFQQLGDRVVDAVEQDYETDSDKAVAAVE